MNKPLINGLLNVDSKIECNNIEDYKKFYPVTTADEINILLVSSLFKHFVFIYPFILNINQLNFS